MTWTTPFDASMSVWVTLATLPAASVSVTLPPSDFAVSTAPLTVVSLAPSAPAAVAPLSPPAVPPAIILALRRTHVGRIP